MAGDTRRIKRQWGQSGPDAFKALVEEFNKVVDDLETLRSATDPGEGDLTAGKIETIEAGDP